MLVKGQNKINSPKHATKSKIGSTGEPQKKGKEDKQKKVKGVNSPNHNHPLITVSSSSSLKVHSETQFNGQNLSIFLQGSAVSQAATGGNLKKISKRQNSNKTIAFKTVTTQARKQQVQISTKHFFPNKSGRKLADESYLSIQEDLIREENDKGAWLVLEQQLRGQLEQKKSQNYNMKKQNLELQKQNEDLRRKYEKLRNITDQNKKSLREKIHNFNSQGEELKRHKQRLGELETELFTLKKEIQILKRNNEALLKSNEELVSNEMKLKHELIDKNERTDESSSNFLPLNTAQPTVDPFNQSLCHLIQEFPLSGIIENSNRRLLEGQQSQSSLPLDQQIVDFLRKEYQNNLKAIQLKYEKLLKRLGQKNFEIQLQMLNLQKQNCRLLAELQSGLNIKIGLETEKGVLLLIEERGKLTLKLQDLSQQLEAIKEECIRLKSQARQIQEHASLEQAKRGIWEHFDANAFKNQWSKEGERLRAQLLKEKQQVSRLLGQLQKKEEIVRKLSVRKTIVFK